MFVEELFPPILHGVERRHAASKVDFSELPAHQQLHLLPGSDDTLDGVVYGELVERMAAVLKTLTPRERRILRGRFYEDAELGELAVELGMKRAGVRGILERGLRKLRYPSCSKRLKSFMED